MILAVTMSRIASVVIARMCVLIGKRGLLKKMMDTMGRGRREKKNKKGNDSQGEDGTKITKCCSHSVDNYLYLYRHGILIKKTWPAQAQSAKLRLIIGWSETASWTVQAEAGPEW